MSTDKFLDNVQNNSPTNPSLDILSEPLLQNPKTENDLQDFEARNTFVLSCADGSIKKKNKKQAVSELNFSSYSLGATSISSDASSQNSVVKAIADFEKASEEKKVVKKAKPASSPHYLGHRERVRNRVMQHIKTVESYEILELLLGYVHTRKDTKPLAKELLHRFGSIWGILNARPSDFDDIAGMGASSKTFFTLLRELVARYFVEPIKVKKSVSIEEIILLVRSQMDGLTHEEVWIALLDNNNRLLGLEKVSQGIQDSVPCSPRMLAEIAFAKNATGILLIHNHPGGVAHPSIADIAITKDIEIALRHMNIRLIEHLILADGHVISFMNNHILTNKSTESFFSHENDTF